MASKGTNSATIDTDIFATYYAKGLAVGAAEGNGFSSFFGGLLSGIEKQQEYDQKEVAIEAAEQGNEIRQNQIDNIPLDNQLKQASVDKSNAELAGYRNDPEQYKDIQISKQNEAAAEAKAHEDYQTKRTEFMNIMGGENGAAKGQAILSGKFGEIAQKEKDLFENSVKTTVSSWDAPDSDKYFTQKKKEEEQKALITATTRMTAQYQAAEEKYLSNPTVAGWITDGKSNPFALLDDAEIREERKLKAFPSPELGPDGKTPTGKNKVNDAGQEVMQYPDVTKLQDSDYVKTFSLYDKKTGDLIKGDITDTDAINQFKQAQLGHAYLNRNMKDQGGRFDMQQDVKATQDQAAQREAAQKAEADVSDKSKQEQIDAFLSGASVRLNPQVQKAAANFQSTRARNLVEIEDQQLDTQKKELAKREGVRQDFLVDDISTPVSSTPDVPAIEKALNEPLTATPTPTPTAYATKTNVANGSTPTPQFADPAKPEPSLDKQVRVSKGQAAIDAVMARKQAAAGGNVTAVPDAPLPPVKQAEALVTSPNLPPRMQTAYKPDAAVIDRVAKIPELAGFPAILKAVVAQESGGNPTAKSPTGVKGLAQFEESTAKGLSPDMDRTNAVHAAAGMGILYNEIALTKVKLVNEEVNFGEHPLLALVSYNVGPGTVATAVRKAGSSDWEAVKPHMVDAIRENTQLVEKLARKGVTPEAKAAEAIDYVKQVARYFPVFARSNDDMQTAELLKKAGVVSY